jgi:hypothetical protein
VSTFATFLLVTLALVFYMLPTVIAKVRGARYGQTILLINFFLGWTVLGWLAALIWAIVEQPKPISARSTARMSEPFYK